MTLSIGKKIGIGFTIALLALVVIGMMTSVYLNQLVEDSWWVTHTVEVQQKLENLEAALPEAESSARGQQLVSNTAYENAFEAAYAKGNAALQDLRRLTADNANQQQRLDLLEPMVGERFKELQELLQLPKGALGAENPKLSKLVQEGMETKLSIHKVLDDMKNEEQDLLKVRKYRADQMSGWTSATIIFGTLLASVFVLAAGFLVTQSITMAKVRTVLILGQHLRASTGANSHPKSRARLWTILSHLLVELPARGCRRALKKWEASVSIKRSRCSDCKGTLLAKLLNRFRVIPS